MGTFITNEGENNLNEQLNYLCNNSKNVDILVGFVYFEGIEVLLTALNNNPDLKLKLLVGLKLDSRTAGAYLYEIESIKNDDKTLKEDIISSYEEYYNHESSDNKITRVNFENFVKLIKEKRIEIRKTRNPNHAKLYLFDKDSRDQNIVIIGSSNLTKRGLEGQEELDVQIDNNLYYEEGKKYFDNQWLNSVDITKEMEELGTNLLKYFVYTPMEAYALLLKYYLENNVRGKAKEDLKERMKKMGYDVFAYQEDAMATAQNIIKQYNGVILADVVGLGKSIITCMLLYTLNKRALILCPPGLVPGWENYKKDFDLPRCEVMSYGKLDVVEEQMRTYDYEVVVIDEAHKFRNMKSKTYEQLLKICKHKNSDNKRPNVVLLTATPINNSALDVLALIKLFSDVNNSPLRLDGKLKKEMYNIQKTINICNLILRNFKGLGLDFYKDNIDPKANKIDTDKINKILNEQFEKIRKNIKDVIVRRNRLDLTIDRYKEVVKNISNVHDPEPCFFELTLEQSKFYDTVINQYFNGDFTGAIYKPYWYEKSDKKDLFDSSGFDLDEEKFSMESNTQDNLADFIKRLLVKRFESCFGSFSETLDRLYNYHIKVLTYLGFNYKDLKKKSKKEIEKLVKTHEFKYKYVIDKKFIESMLNDDEDEEEYSNYEQLLAEFLEKHKNDKRKSTDAYDVNKFAKKEEFIYNIVNDAWLFEKIKTDLINYDLIENDPKFNKLIEIMKETQEKKQGKLVVFSEYTDTVKYLRSKIEKLNKSFVDSIMFVYEKVEKSKYDTIRKEFDASCKEEDKTNKNQIMIATDIMSEGFNLNRADTIISYDIPWNPVRVIQRLGRINRIGKKEYDDLYIYNFFPTEQGANIIDSKKIAENKMKLIHNVLGEDAKIFDATEKTKKSGLCDMKLDDMEEKSFNTIVTEDYDFIQKEHPEIIEKINRNNLRIKSADIKDENNMFVFLKGKKLFPVTFNEFGEPTSYDFEDIYDKVRCMDPNNKGVFNNDTFLWEKYHQLENFYKIKEKEDVNPNSIKGKALKNLNILLRTKPDYIKPHLEKVSKLYNFLKVSDLMLDSEMKELINIKNEDDIDELDNLYAEYIANNTNDSIEKQVIIGIQNIKGE